MGNWRGSLSMSLGGGGKGGMGQLGGCTGAVGG